MRSTFSMALMAVVALACTGSLPFDPAGAGPRPTIATIQPSSAAVGDPLVITGTGFTATGNAVKIGAGYLNKLASTDAMTIRFKLPGYLVACPPGQEVCAALALPLPPGTYKVAVVNANGKSNDVSLVVVEK
jgi:ABC-type transport system substrate-binding protein